MENIKVLVKPEKKIPFNEVEVYSENPPEGCSDFECITNYGSCPIEEDILF